MDNFQICIKRNKEGFDNRNSPAIKFIKILNRKKINTDFYDPNVKVLRSRQLEKEYTSIKLNKKNIKKYDCVVIITDHANINYKLIENNAKLVVDTRNVYKSRTKKILKL